MIDKISVIITSFNGEEYISKAIESFLQQQYESKELIIIDGISTDKTHQIISSYQEKFPNLIKWIKEKDHGISNARNIALKYATGDLIGFLGCDDFLHPNFFKEASYYISINQNFDIIYFNSYCIGFSNSFSQSSAIQVNQRNLIKFCPIGSGESFYYRKKIFENFLFNEKNLYSMDYELNMQIASSKKLDGKKYQFFPVNITAVFNQNIGTNQSSLNSVKQRLETILIQWKYCNSLKDRIKIFWRVKKIVLKNFIIFNQLRKNFK
jgi:glycosyltransferase involved in cell wall biosynthesis